MTERMDITIIGAGVVGLAIAAEVARPGRDICILERHEAFGRETSSRNSEVVHAGIYYTPGSLKARLCVEGRDLLYALCERHAIPCKRLTKIIVASSADEIPRLEAIRANAIENGAGDLRMLSRSEIADIEPDVKAEAAFLSPLTGIVDSHSLMAHFERVAQDAGALPSYHANVVGIDRLPGASGFRVTIEEEGETFDFETRVLVNSAGLGADHIAAMAGIDIDAADYRLRPCKGSYFSVQGPNARRVGRLVYPLPYAHGEGVGVHVTLDLQGRVRLGPDVEYTDSRDDYAVDPTKRQAFFESARKFLPFLALDDLAPDMAGIRPKLQEPGEPTRDFVIRHEADRDLPGLINLIGIESPGLTASPAIARHVAGIIDGIL
jgi:L-2-hydroxyglutarate oxidase LhgO